MNTFTQFGRKSFTSSGATPAKVIATLTSSNLTNHGRQRQKVRIIAPHDGQYVENSCGRLDIARDLKLDGVTTKGLEEVPPVDFLEERRLFRAFVELLKKI